MVVFKKHFASLLVLNLDHNLKTNQKKQDLIRFQARSSNLDIF